jgi:hypothetical protein
MIAIARNPVSLAAAVAPGPLHLVTLLTAGGVERFGDPACARLVAAATVRPGTWGDATLLAWVLMPDHWQALIRAGADAGIDEALLRFRRATSARLYEHCRLMPLWAEHAQQRVLARDADAPALARELIALPLRSRLVERIGDYPYWDCAWPP